MIGATVEIDVRDYISDDLRGGLRVYFVETDDDLLRTPHGSRCYWDFESARKAADRATHTDEDGIRSWGSVRGIALKGKPTDDSMTIAGHLWMDVDAAKTSDRLHPIPGFTRNDIYRDTMLERDELVKTLVGIIGDMCHDLEDANTQFGAKCLSSKLRGYKRRLYDAGVVAF